MAHPELQQSECPEGSVSTPGRRTLGFLFKRNAESIRSAARRVRGKSGRADETQKRGGSRDLGQMQVSFTGLTILAKGPLLWLRTKVKAIISRRQW